MANRKDAVMQQLNQLAGDLQELWKAATRDPAVEQRKQRAWTILSGVVGAAAAMGMRRTVAKYRDQMQIPGSRERRAVV